MAQTFYVDIHKYRKPFPKTQFQVNSSYNKTATKIKYQRSVSLFYFLDLKHEIKFFSYFEKYIKFINFLKFKNNNTEKNRIVTDVFVYKSFISC